MIHIIGDSHSLTFSGAQNVECHWLGAATAMNLWKKNKIVSKIFLDNKGQDFWFGFGEIDCRIHIFNLSQTTGVPEYVLINNTIDCYLNYLGANKIHANISVMAAPPQGLEENVYGYPFYASRKHRQELTDLYNTMLERRCWEHGIKFIDIWYPTSSMERLLWNSQDFKEDLCHMKNEVAIKRLELYLK